MATGQPIVIVFTQWHTVTLILCSYSLLRKALSMGYNVKKILFCKSIINLAFETVIYLNLSKIFNRSAAFENLYLWMSESLIVSRITMNHWKSNISKWENDSYNWPTISHNMPKADTEYDWNRMILSKKEKELRKKKYIQYLPSKPG